MFEYGVVHECLNYYYYFFIYNECLNSNCMYICMYVCMYECVTPRCFRGCLVCDFKQQFSVFKQHFTHFNILFYPHVFPQIFLNNNFQFLNTYTKRPLSFLFPFFFFFYLWTRCFILGMSCSPVIISPIISSFTMDVLYLVVI